MKTEKVFPNGFSDWQETHYEIVTYLATTVDYSGSIANKAEVTGGKGKLYELAEELTDEFENLYKGKEWDSDYLDTIEEFLKNKEI